MQPSLLFRRFIGSVLLIAIVSVGTGAQDHPSMPIYEPDNPRPLVQPDLDRWNYTPAGLHGSVGSTDVRYDRDVVPMFDVKTSWSATAWRGEKLNLQLVLWSPTGVRQVRVVAAPLSAGDGKVIPASAVHANFLRYVVSENEYTACERRDPLNQPVLHADVLDNLDRFDIAMRSTRPVWVTVSVPQNAAPGVYKGKLAVRAENRALLEFDLSVDVLPLVLPEPANWSFHLDLWQNPWAVARVHDVKPWSPEHIALLRPLLKLLGEAGEKCITTSIIPHPWNAQTYDAYETMVEWIRHADGRWSFDYSVFDRYVELCEEYGITKQINCYSMICFRTNSFRYLDEATGDHQYVVAEPGTKAYEAHWRPFLHDLVRHLKQRGWLEKTCIAMDERPFELMSKIILFLRAEAPELKIALAAEDAHEGMSADIHDYSLSFSRFTKREILAQRNERGLPTTAYVCCAEHRPNTYLSSSPAESTCLGWSAAARGFSGFLRWAYNSWEKQPLWDARGINYAPGECFLVYPGARSSIRFERLREGIQDFEKIRILKEKLQEAGTAEAGRELAELDRLLGGHFQAAEHRDSCAIAVNAAKKALEDLARKVSRTDTD